MKLHLGCGQRYLDGYVNIDLPSSEHSVQTQSIADRQEDFTKVRFERSTIEEVRLHHVFEHIPRDKAVALLSCWNSWLKPGGVLRIEVPDAKRTALAFLNPFASSRKRCVALRHIFGSQEASWAVHYHGYSKKDFKRILPKLGFEIEEVSYNSWKGTFNIEVLAIKKQELPRENILREIRMYLSSYLVDESQGEIALLETWMDTVKKQLQVCYAA